MALVFYLDTSIWRDYLDDRSDGVLPLGEFAFQFLKKCREQKDRILYSELVIHELSRHLSQDKIKPVFDDWADVLQRVTISKKQFDESERMAKSQNIHSADALHAVLARDNHAVMITRDSHFQNIKDLVTAVKPEEFIFDD